MRGMCGRCKRRRFRFCRCRLRRDRLLRGLGEGKGQKIGETTKGLVLVGLLVACFAAGAVGRAFMRASAGAWYEGLAKPAWRPPDWVFGPVWTFLYACMAVAGWLFWLRAWPQRATAGLVAFGIQLVLNAAWTAVFFWAQRPGAAFAEIAALWCAIATTVVLFWRASAAAGVLLLPYWGWVTFAAVLNFALWRMNV